METTIMGCIGVTGYTEYYAVNQYGLLDLKGTLTYP